MSLNLAQKKAARLLGVAVAGSLVFPPFQIQGTSLGFDWIFSPPHPYAVIDPGMILVEWMGLGLLAICAMYFLNPKSLMEKSGKRSSEIDDSSPVGGSFAISALVVLLRASRIGIGFILIVQIAGLFPIITWLANPHDVGGEALAQLIIKVGILLVAMLCFSLIRPLINRLHKAATAQDPPLLPTKWSL